MNKHCQSKLQKGFVAKWYKQGRTIPHDVDSLQVEIAFDEMQHQIACNCIELSFKRSFLCVRFEVVE